MWRRGPELFADVMSPTMPDVDVEWVRIHPLVLDAALHAMGVVGEQAATTLPFPQGPLRVPRGALGSGADRAAGDGTVSVEFGPIRRGYRCCRYRHYHAFGRLSCCRRPSPLPMPQVAGCWRRGCQWNSAHDDTRRPRGLELSLSRTVWVRRSGWPSGVGGTGVPERVGRLGGADPRVGRLMPRTAGRGGGWCGRPAEHPSVMLDSDGSMDVGDVIGCGEEQLMIRNGNSLCRPAGTAGPQPILQLPDTNPAGGWSPAARAPLRI